MPADHILKFINPQPGIQRDGTQYDSDTCIDGQWVRWYRGKPRKIGGYKLTSPGTGEIVRNMYVVSKQNGVDVYLGRPSSLHMFHLTENGAANSEIDRTPVGFNANPNNQWTFDLYTALNAASPITLGNNPLSVTNGSNVVTVTVPSTFALKTGDSVTISGAATTGGITPANLNITAEVTIINSTSFSYQALSAATSTVAAGGGNTVNYSTDASVTYLVGAAPPNATNINNNTESLIYWGDVNSATAFTPISTSNQKTSGGVVVLYPYLFKYGNDGVVTWTLDPSGDWSDAKSASIAGTKIVKGLRTRGGGEAPAGLFWSLNSLIRCTFVGEPTDFRFDTIQDDISIISPNSIVTAGNVFYWIGIDQFYMYTGVIKKLGNNMNRDYFFNNINMDYKEKIFGVLNKYNDEIWWFYPRGNNTECSHVIIYNYAQDTWYDSAIGRSAAYPTETYQYPLMSDAQRSINYNDPNRTTTVTLGANPIATNNGSSVVVVTVPSTVGIQTGDKVTISNATATGGFTIAQLNIPATVTILTPTTFSYEVQGVATSSSNGGGTNVTITYASNLTYPIWTHEYGTDKISYGNTLAIPAYFETNITAYFDQNPQDDRQMRVRRIEPDFVQTGEMTLIVNSRRFPRSPVQSSSPYIFYSGQEKIELNKIDTVNMGRLVSFRFESNVAGGYFQMGNSILNYAPGDIYP